MLEPLEPRTGRTSSKYDQWFYVEQYAPEFESDVHQKLDSLAALVANWDGQGALAIDPAIIAAAKQFVSNLPENIASSPAVVPMAKGNLQFEWHDGSRTLELEFEDPDTIHYLKWHPEERTEEEDYLNVVDIDEAAALIRWFMKGVANV
jgi:hypothetical protein